MSEYGRKIADHVRRNQVQYTTAGFVAISFVTGYCLGVVTEDLRIMSAVMKAAVEKSPTP
jgi:hypothetical protein